MESHKQHVTFSSVHIIYNIIVYVIVLFNPLVMIYLFIITRMMTVYVTHTEKVDVLHLQNTLQLQNHIFDVPKINCLYC